MAKVRYEQAVYGSFPFWDRGYALLAASPGCAPGWLQEFVSICQRYGIPSAPPPFAFTGAVFALRLPRGGPWLVALAAPQGVDDRGRPGALAFHGLFVTPSELRKSPLGPFGLVGALRSDWAARTTLEAGVHDAPPLPADEPLPPEQEALREPIAAALALGRKVALESSEPITLLARAVWRMDPRLPRTCSFATLAGSTAIPFDLVALPRLAGDLADYVTPTTLPAFVAHAEPRIYLRLRRLLWPALGLGVLLGALWLSHEFREPTRPAAAPVLQPYVPPRPRPANLTPPPPRPAASGAENPDEAAAVAEALRDLAARYGVAVDPPGAGPDDPASLIRQVGERLRFRGGTCDEPGFLRGERGPEARRLQAVQAHLERHFMPERPLPDNLETGPLAWQLAVLAWSFDVPLPPDLQPAEVPFHLAEALRVPSAPRAVPAELAAACPALADQLAFVANLPRRP